MMLCLWFNLHLCYMLTASLIRELLSLSNNSSYIFIDIVWSLDLFALFDYLSVNNRLLTSYVTVSAI